MIVISDINLNDTRITNVVHDGDQYKRIEYVKNGEVMDIQWSKTNTMSNHLNFDDMLNEFDSKKLEKSLFEYRTLNKLTESDSLIIT